MIEDSPDSIQGIIDFCKDENYDCLVNDFEAGLSIMEQFDPDIVILDLKNNVGEGFDGLEILDRIWEKNFRPVCVFSAQINESTIETNNYNSLLVKFVNKGDETPVIDYLKRIAPYGSSISTVRKRTNEAMRHAFDFIDLAIADNITDAGIISKMCNNRIKAYFDKENEGQDMPAWSQYIYPVLDNNFLTGDIIRLKNRTGEPNSEDDYFIILSQSCDISHGNIDFILVAQGDKISNIGTFKKPDRYVTILNTGFERHFVPMPEIKNVMPDLAFNLKKLSLIPLIEIGGLYEKIASLASPYKERLIWAYMSNACRPGVPDLAVEEWAQKFSQNVVEDKK